MFIGIFLCREHPSEYTLFIPIQMYAFSLYYLMQIIEKRGSMSLTCPASGYMFSGKFHALLKSKSSIERLYILMNSI